MEDAFASEAFDPNAIAAGPAGLVAVGSLPTETGSGWCTNSFSLVYKTKTMTYNMGDETSRVLMNLDPGDLYCFIHYNLLPLVVENYKNIQTGLEM